MAKKSGVKFLFIGLGYSDVENRLPCHPDTVMRIASISKPITMAAVAKMMEAGKLDLNKPIQTYLPQFPEKTVDGEKATITTRQLVSHLAGIRHYDRSYIQKKQQEHKDASASIKSQDVKSKDSNPVKDTPTLQKKSKEKGDNSVNNKQGSGMPADDAPKNEMLLPEYYLKKKFSSVTAALSIFKDDPLLHKPGSKFTYTTHGWTLVSAVLEAAAGVPFEKLIRGVLKELGLDHTYLEENEPLIYNRSRHYIKKKGRLVNAPYVDLSYKWAGGGMMSTVGDMVKFGNAMLYSYQYRPHSTWTVDKKANDTKDHTGNVTAANASLKTAFEAKNKEFNKSKEKECSDEKQNVPGYLKPETIKSIWTPVENTKLSLDKDGRWYGMGWEVIPEQIEHGHCRHQKHYVSHTGGAIGASSVLLILPHRAEDSKGKIPHGIVVAIVVNMTSVGLRKSALQIAQVFENVEMEY